MTRLTRTLVVVLGLVVVTLAAQTKHWAYEDSGDGVGPAKWGTLPGDATCATGTQQTPINLVVSGARSQDLPNLAFAYKPSRLSMVNNGHTVQMTYDAGSKLGRVGMTNTLTLAQFHFHAPSEHTVDGVSYPMEAHLVHVDAAGKPAAVIGVFVKAGKENAGLTRAFQSLPARSGHKSAPAGATIDARALLPADTTFFTYQGSLTTPPCTEGLTWYVFKTPIEMSAGQISAFTKLEHLGHTNRPIQNLGGRVVLVDSTPGK
jgi:carbonic anhydrase